jgi:hypothetical protein
MIEVNITAVEVSDSEDGFHSDIGHVILALAHHLGAEGGCGALTEELVVILLNVNFFLDGIDSLSGNVACTFKAIGDFQGMDTLIEKFLSLIEESTCEDDDTCGSITDFIVLRL